MTDLYISADIEADGPIPGRYSMLAFGLAVAATFDGGRFVSHDPSRRTFYRELRPSGQDVDERALAAAQLDREALVRDGAEPADAMREAAEWVTAEAARADARPVLIGYPVVFDWMFLYWYFITFAGESPFGFSGALDIKTVYQQKGGITLDHAGRRDLPASLQPTREHTHNALDDAIGQAEIFIKLWPWAGPDSP